MKDKILLPKCHGFVETRPKTENKYFTDRNSNKLGELGSERDFQGAVSFIQCYFSCPG